ncbi:hypothetical protein AB0C12_16935 [Actinoplanes sp. NPDC048967]|uniref:hypothetical protein n=1 Tax=Actinoplanes sp. NPDC048967 TaxID=3155269 RepID=UPI0034083C99
MGAPPDIREYFYWSERKIARIARDGGLNVSTAGSTKYKSPTGPFLPSVEIDRPRPAPARDAVAARIERYLSAQTVRDFVTPPRVRFAAGHGTLTFAQFVNFGKIEDTVSIFTEARSSTGSRVAICMFGSMDNLADVIATAPTTRTGWSSSAAPEIFRFISSFGRDVATGTTEEEIAREAVNLLCHQGGSANERGRRGFTYGHLGNSGEWMLEAYQDLDVSDDPAETDAGAYDRVVIGAPLWIRTPTPQALVLYGQDQDQRTDEAPLFPSVRSQRVPWWRHLLP